MDKGNIKEKDRSEAMGRGKIWPLLWRFSAPAIVSMLVASSYNIVDAIFIGRLGPEALAALAIAFPLMIIYMAIGMGIAVGSASRISRYLGAGKRQEADMTVGAGITLFLILGALLTIVFYPNLENILRLFGADESVLTLALAYMKIETMFILLNFFMVVLAEIVRAEGSPVLSSAASIIAGVLNCIIDPFLIFGLGPFPEMGIAGAAVATTIGRGIVVVFLLFYLLSNRSSYKLRLSYFLPKLREYKEIMHIGFATMVRMSGGSIVQILAARSAASFGVIPLAVLGVIFRVVSFVFMPCMGIGQATMPLVGYNYGAKKNQRVGEIVVKAGIASTGWAILCWIVIMIATTAILSLFGNDAEYLSHGVWAFRIFAITFFTIGIQITVSSFFQGLGRALPALIVGSARQVIFLIPGILLLPRFFGLTGLWIAFPIADILGAVVSLVWVMAEFRRIGLRLRSVPVLSDSTHVLADNPTEKE